MKVDKMICYKGKKNLRRKSQKGLSRKKRYGDKNLDSDGSKTERKIQKKIIAPQSSAEWITT